MIAHVTARFTDRIRPWAAPDPPERAPTVAVIGAGPAGLATAALLRWRGINAIVFDRGSDVGGSWASRYDSLRLNTIRWMSDLPGYRMPRRLGRWVVRDDIVRYLRSYADHHDLPVRLGDEALVERIERTPDAWILRVGGGEHRVDGVVVATGHSRQPILPEWPGRDRFLGRLLHAADYRRPADHSGARVLVVGAGSSGGEICVDLARSGIDVTWSVRSVPRLFPREFMGVPATPVAPIAEVASDTALDRIAPWVERRVYGPRDYLPEPTRSMMTMLADCKEPMTADGIVSLVRAGSVRVVGAATDLHATGAIVDGDGRVPADDIIAATGYRPGLESLVGHLDVLRSGRPIDLRPLTGLGFVGFRIPFTGTLWAIERDARAVARSLADELGTR